MPPMIGRRERGIYRLISRSIWERRGSFLRGRLGRGNDTRIDSLLPERARSECARSTGAVEPIRVPFPGEWKKRVRIDWDRRPVDPRCLRNARPSKGPRWTRAVEGPSAPIHREKTNEHWRDHHKSGVPSPTHKSHVGPPHLYT